MNNFGEMVSELSSRLQSSKNSTLYTTLRKESLIRSAHFKAASYKDWPELVRCKSTNTTTNEYYDMPIEFKTDSIVRLEIDGQPYDKKNFNDFRQFIFDNSDKLDSYVPGKTLDVYGCIQPADFTSNSSTTIFSLSDVSGNEAIVKFAEAEALKKTNPNLSTILENEAKEILNIIWKKISSRQQGDIRLNRPLLNVPDFFGPRTTSYELPQPKYIYSDYQRKIFIASFK